MVFDHVLLNGVMVFYIGYFAWYCRTKHLLGASAFLPILRAYMELNHDRSWVHFQELDLFISITDSTLAAEYEIWDKHAISNLAFTAVPVEESHCKTISNQ